MAERTLGESTEAPLEELIAQFINGVTNRVASNADAIGDDEYRRIRKILLSHPHIEPLVPEFVRKSRSTDDVWRFFKKLSLDESRLGTWAARRQYIQEQLEPIRNAVEGASIQQIGDYELVEPEPLGTGGFGAVYRYRHRRLQIDFAIKVLDPAFGMGGESALARFFQEARMLFSLRHANIIQVHDIGMIGSRPFIRMEYFAGVDLSKVVRRGTITPLRALPLIYEIASGLAHAHLNGVVHRDLKPSNVLTAKPRQVRIIDFGLGVYVENELHSRLTKSGEQVATGHYTAPELVSNPLLVDRRSDIYSLGAIWYELLVGRAPVGIQVSERLRECFGLNRDYADTVLQCLADVDHRFKSAEDLMVALDALQFSISAGE